MPRVLRNVPCANFLTDFGRSSPGTLANRLNKNGAQHPAAITTKSAPPMHPNGSGIRSRRLPRLDAPVRLWTDSKTRKRIGMIGFGSTGRELLALMLELASVDEMVVFDDLEYLRQPAGAYPLEGYREPRFKHLEFYIGFGYLYTAKKLEVLEDLERNGRIIPAFVHPSCFIHPTSSIGAGCIIFPMCNLGRVSKVGRGTLLNNSVTISHESAVGDACYLAPGTVLCGGVTVGDGCFLGAGTTISHRRTIGNLARVGIGTVVTQDIPAAKSAIGNPMRLLDRTLQLD